MKKIIVVVCGLSFFLSFCSSEKTKNENAITYSCDIDNVIHWSGKEECKKIKGHTGEYCAFVDSTKEFGFGYKMSLAEISDKQLKKVRFKAWILSDNPSSQVSLILSIEKDGKVYQWKGVKVTDFQVKPNEWFEAIGESEIPNNIPRDANVLMYIWSSDKTSALADDFEISFE